MTPLYLEHGKIKTIHRVGEVKAGGRYSFYVGFAETEVVDSPSFDAVYNALLNTTGRHKFGDLVLDVELVSLESIDVLQQGRETVTGLKSTGKIRVVFASPTLLRDPFRAGKHKSLIPTPLNIFSTPLYVNLYLSGELSQRVYLTRLIILHRLLNEPHSVHKTTRVVKIRYDASKNPIPTLIGYVNLYLNSSYYDHYTRRNINVDAMLEETLATMLALGTGTSRATGFGHVTVTPTSGT